MGLTEVDDWMRNKGNKGGKVMLEIKMKSHSEKYEKGNRKNTELNQEIVF